MCSADGPSHRNSSFRTKADAQVFAARLCTDQANGEWISRAAGGAGRRVVKKR